MIIQAKETIYNGYRFRSRLEARWAVFFDTAGIKYQYETTDQVLPDETRYLPDFWLPDWECWVEIKGRTPTAREQEKCKGLTQATQHESLLIAGDCWPGAYQMWWYQWDDRIDLSHPFWEWDQVRFHECRWCLGYWLISDDYSGHSHCVGECDSWKYNGADEGERLTRAFNAARQARFEWGQTPVAPVRLQPVATTWRPGDKARHPTYGEGTVVAYESAEDKVTMAFLDPPRIKSFLAKRANLALIYRPS